MKPVAMFFMIVLGCCNVVICDQLDRYASPFYRNSYQKHQWTETVGVHYTSNGGRSGKPRKVVRTEIIPTRYSFRLVRKLDNSTGIFDVFINGREQNYMIVVEDMNLVNSATDDMFYLLDWQTLWCIGVYNNANGYTMRKFTSNRQRVIEMVQKHCSANRSGK